MNSHKISAHRFDGVEIGLGPSASTVEVFGVTDALRQAADLIEANYDWRELTTISVQVVADGCSISSVPKFAPDGTFDYYRGQWFDIEPRTAAPDGSVYGALRIINHNDGTTTNHINVTAEQAEFILAYLSEQSRSAK